MLFVDCKDITKIMKKIEVVVSPSNSFAVMNGGFSAAIKYAAGYPNPNIQDEARKIFDKNKKPFGLGSVFITSSGELKKKGVKEIYHVVTINVSGGFTSIQTIREAVKNVLKTAVKNDVKSIAMPGLGIGSGSLDKELVAQAMLEEVKEYQDFMDIHILDIDEEFITILEKKLGVVK